MSESRLTDAARASEQRGSAESSSRPRDTQDSAQRARGSSNASETGTPDLGTIGQEAVSQAQEQAVKIVSQAREQVTANVTSHSVRAAGIATVLGTALRDAGTQLREQDDAPAATYFDQAADQVEQIRTMLETQDYGQLIATVQGFARRQPVLFFTAAVTVGVIGSRFLKSSSPASPSSQSGPDAYGGSRNLQGGNDARTGGNA